MSYKRGSIRIRKWHYKNMNGGWKYSDESVVIRITCLSSLPPTMPQDRANGDEL